MNKKILTSIVTLGIIATSVANAAITKEQCNRSDKTIWVENVTNSDGSRGACVPKNACKSKVFKDKFCNTIFKDIQVQNQNAARKLILHYIYKNYNIWENIGIDYISTNNTLRQDYIGALFAGNYLTFEFDDTNETIVSTALEGYAKGVCIIYGQYKGKESQDGSTIYKCAVTKDVCEGARPFLEGLSGKYVNGICEYII